MKKLEAKFWKKLKDNLKLDLLKRIENRVEPGWPDTHYIHDGYPGWMELKAAEDFPNKIDFEPAQPLWLEKYWNLGGVCYVLLHVVQEQAIYVWAGKFARDLYRSGGTHEVKPMLKVKTNTQGWIQLYEMFSRENLRIV